MRPEKELIQRLNQADDDGLVGLVRELCEIILKSSPDYTPILLRYADNLAEFSQYEEASAVIEHAQRVAPASLQQFVLAQKGHLCERMGNYPDAEKFHLEAHCLKPDEASFLIYAGAIAFRRGSIKRAEEFARKATLCKDGAIDEAYFNLAGYLLAQKRYEEAEPCYLKAIEIDPDYSEARQRLADLKAISKNSD